MTEFPPDVVAAVVQHMQQDHADHALDIVRVLGGQSDATAARTTSVDALGLDLVATTPRGEVPVRVLFATPARARADLRREVVALHARAAARS